MLAYRSQNQGVMDRGLILFRIVFMPYGVVILTHQVRPNLGRNSFAPVALVVQRLCPIAEVHLFSSSRAARLAAFARNSGSLSIADLISHPTNVSGDFSLRYCR